MKITEVIVQRLMELIGVGFTHGAGETKRHFFCVQQAVSMAVAGKKGKAYSDHPRECVSEELISLGIRLNDQGGFKNVKSRSEGLKRFAVAELGSNKLPMEEFRKRLREKADVGDDYCDSAGIYGEYMTRSKSKNGKSTEERSTKFANMVADVLQDMESEGSKFLHLLDETDEHKARHEAYKIGGKIWASELAESFTKSCSATRSGCKL